ncbi:jg26701, partial [Pararge aegeria aegeria]
MFVSNVRFNASTVKGNIVSNLRVLHNVLKDVPPHVFENVMDQSDGYQSALRQRGGLWPSSLNIVGEDPCPVVAGNGLIAAVEELRGLNTSWSHHRLCDLQRQAGNRWRYSRPSIPDTRHYR